MNIQKSRKPKPVIKGEVIWLGIGLGALYWVLDAAMDSFIFDMGDFVSEIFFPDRMCLWMRIINGFIIGIFAFYANFMLNKSRATEEELKRNREHLEKIVNERTAEMMTAINFLTEEINFRKSTEEALRQNEGKMKRLHGMKVLGELAAGVAHEVRNPLHALMSVTEALRQELKGTSELEIYLFHINEQVNRLSLLMRDLLDLGKPVEPSNIRLESLSEICSASIDLWEHLPVRQGREVTLLRPEDYGDIFVIADSQRLQQVFLNLLDNAAHHSPEGGNIRVVIHVPMEDMVRVHVVDEGSGIPEEVLPRIFEPFFSTRRGGTGLGLNIVRNIIESHGGNLAICNNDPLPGCTAEVSLPVTKA